MLSQTAEYALRTVLYLADRDDDRLIGADELADALGVPRNYLSKTLHRLTRERILASARGKGGGFRLATDPRRLTLFRVVEPFDAISAERRCLLGRPACDDRQSLPCPPPLEGGEHAGGGLLSQDDGRRAHREHQGTLLQDRPMLSSRSAR